MSTTAQQQPRRRSSAKHLAICRAAAALVSEAGYDAATIEGVAARAGVGKQTIYRWWPSKPALYAEVYASLASEDALRFDTGSVREDLMRLLLALFSVYRTTPAADILAGLIAEAQHDATAAEALRGGLVVGRSRLLLDPMRRAQARGELPPDYDIAWANDAIVAMIWHRVLTGQRGLNRRFAAQLLSLVLDGARAP